nr:immunoglobulin heavy chain junction region [Mus musculus]
CASPGNWFAYW